MSSFHKPTRIATPHLVVGSLFMGLLTACTFTLAEDITPPPGYRPPAATQAAPVTAPQAALPARQPDPRAGAGIYTEKCAPCHGEGGLGDGPQAAQLPNPPASIGAPDLARQAVPAEWYDIITQGNLERFMPPFAGSLTDRQRWDVVAYLYTLSTSEGQIARGEDLYQENCAGCHGEAGAGDGPEAAGLSVALPDLSDPAWMARESSEDLFVAISAGTAPAMPSFEVQIDEADRWALATYLRTLSFVAAGTGEGLAVEEPGSEEPVEVLPDEAPEVGVGKITGRVLNGSGEALEMGMLAVLHAYDNMQEVYSTTTTVAADGRFIFSDVEMPLGRVFLVTVDYSQATYGSDVAIVEETTRSLDFPITVYETTTDTSGLMVDRLHIFLDFVGPETVQVTELYLISNPMDKVVVPAAGGEPVVTFSLPEGASNLQFQDGVLGGRYLETEDGFGDTVSVRPGTGQYQVLFAYNMPYQGKLELAQIMKMPVNAVIVLLPDLGVRIRSESLQDTGTRNIQGEDFQVYAGDRMAAGSRLVLSLSGRPKGIGPAAVGSDSSINLLIGVGALGLALVVAGVWLYRRNQVSDDVSLEEEPDGEQLQDRDSLMDAIIALDDLYTSGRLPEDAYLQRRTELKARLQRTDP